MDKRYLYFVEGECEEKFINIFKAPPYNYFLPGKVVVFNFINKYITNKRLALIKPDTNIILVYDTDVRDIAKLEANIRILKTSKFKHIYHIQSIQTFEDEVVFATNLSNINSFYGTSSCEEFKERFLHQECRSLVCKLDGCSLNLDKFWIRKSSDSLFRNFYSEEAIKLIRK